MKILTSHPAGLTLLEMMIAVSLFTVVMIISTTMFLRAIDSQQRSVNSKELQESLSYALAYMSNEASGVVQDPTSCNVACIDSTAFFCSFSSNTKLTYRNASSQCITYEIENDGAIPRLKVTRAAESDYITPSTIRMTSLVFYVGNTDDATYPIGVATMALTGQTLNGKDFPDSLRLQTTVANWP